MDQIIDSFVDNLVTAVRCIAAIVAAFALATLVFGYDAVYADVMAVSPAVKMMFGLVLFYLVKNTRK